MKKTQENGKKNHVISSDKLDKELWWRVSVPRDFLFLFSLNDIFTEKMYCLVLLNQIKTAWIVAAFHIIQDKKNMRKYDLYIHTQKINKSVLIHNTIQYCTCLFNVFSSFFFFLFFYTNDTRLCSLPWSDVKHYDTISYHVLKVTFIFFSVFNAFFLHKRNINNKGKKKMKMSRELCEKAPYYVKASFDLILFFRICFSCILLFLPLSRLFHNLFKYTFYFSPKDNGFIKSICF